MPNAILDGLLAMNASGYVIILAIVTTLFTAVTANLLINTKYARIEADLDRDRAHDEPFRYPFLNHAVQHARDAARRDTRQVNLQAIVEHNVQSQLEALLVGERFVRGATGLVIILGLVGTFYGLTLSIGKLVALVASDTQQAGDIAQTITAGLTQSLSGMSVAFSTSLFGIVAAIVLTVIGTFSNVTDRRTAFMVRLEVYLDKRLADEASRSGRSTIVGIDGTLPSGAGDLERIVVGFAQSVARLESSVDRFDTALKVFATNTRDFTEFNLHLKDNVQRMSLSFGDLSETLQTQIGALKSADRR